MYCYFLFESHKAPVQHMERWSVKYDKLITDNRYLTKADILHIPFV